MMRNIDTSAVIFDGQVFQSAAWDRGMGKYSLNLLGALLKNKQQTYDGVYIFFTTKLELKDEAKQAIKMAAPSAEFVYLNLLVPNIHDHATIKPLEKHNKKILDGFVDSLALVKRENTDFIILSLFIDQVCSVFPSYTNNVLLFYDLIPLQYTERYGGFHNYGNYLARFKTILEARYIWTISQTVADDLMLHMGIDPRKLRNINGAPIDRDHQISKEPTHINIPKKFLLMPSGNDLRKNNLRAVRGFEEYRSIYDDNGISLVITSFFDDGTRNALNEESDNLIFTGNVTEGELQWLYEHASALLFAPEYEGLGLPILEAIDADQPIICSNLTVFNEMSVSAFYYADQFDPLSIAHAINTALSKQDWVEKKAEYSGILKRYTWEKTAEDALQFINESAEVMIEDTKKQRLAVFTPDPSGYSAIGKFTLHLHPTLSDFFNIDYFVEKGVTGRGPVRPSYLGDVAHVFDAKIFNAKTYSQYDAVVYNIGNSEFHLDTIKNSLYLPGYAIVHDTNLGPIFAGELLAHDYITKERLELEGLIDKQLTVKKTSHIASIMNAQLGIIAHSDYAVESIKEVLNIKNPVSIYRANLPVAVPKMKKLKIERPFSIGFAGIIHPAKGINIVDQIISSGLFEDAFIYLFGIPLVSEDELTRLESLPNVTVLTNLTDFQFQTQLASIDVLVNYRAQYNGEASAATIESMRAGVVPIVRRIGWFDELPDNSVMKVDSETDVLTALNYLYTHPDEMSDMSLNARTTMNESFSQVGYSERLFEIINNEMDKKRPSRNNDLSKALHKGLSKLIIDEKFFKE